LLASHQQFPWIAVWDDHEVADNTYRDGAAELNNTEDSFLRDGGISVDQRKMNAVRAYFEWMPIRQVDMDDNLRVWRSFQIGKLIDLVMLDTRQYDRSITDLYWNTDYIYEIANDAGRSLMGSRQENWMYRTLSESAERGATWRVVGSQIVFAHVDRNALDQNGHGVNVDAWDGYQSNKNRTLNHLYSNNINNNIFLAGDSHASWVSDLVWLDEKSYDSKTGEGSIGVEFAGSAVSSPCPYGENITLATANNYSHIIESSNSELQWQDLYYRGYFELHFTKDKVDANFFGTPQIRVKHGWEIPIANFTVMNGANKLQRPVAGGVVESGSLKNGQMVQTNLTLDTATGKWFES
jgi:alkaline phosphatase D